MAVLGGVANTAASRKPGKKPSSMSITSSPDPRGGRPPALIWPWHAWGAPSTRPRGGLLSIRSRAESWRFSTHGARIGIATFGSLRRLCRRSNTDRPGNAIIALEMNRPLILAIRREEATRGRHPPPL